MATDKLSQRDKYFLALLDRAPDLGDGWRQVAKVIWPIVEGFSKRELLELDEEHLRVRLNDAGRVVTRYL